MKKYKSKNNIKILNIQLIKNIKENNAIPFNLYELINYINENGFTIYSKWIKRI